MLEAKYNDEPDNTYSGTEKMCFSFSKCCICFSENETLASDMTRQIKTYTVQWLLYINEMAWNGRLKYRLQPALQVATPSKMETFFFPNNYIYVQ